MSKLSNCIHGQIQDGHELKAMSKGVGGAMRRTAEQKANHQEGAMETPPHEAGESKKFEMSERDE